MPAAADTSTSSRTAAALKVETAYGRLYVSGPAYALAARCPGASVNTRRRWIELSLTLQSLRALKDALNFTSAQLAAHCSENVMRWARAAKASEDIVREIHRRINAGELRDLPWSDARAGRPAPEGADGSVDGAWLYRPPFHHQRVMATAAIEADGMAFICDMGTGKTRAAIEAMRARRRAGSIHHALVLCPAGVMGTWMREVQMWGGGELRAVALDGSVRERCGMLAELERGRTTGEVLILNYEAVYRMADQIEHFVRSRRVMLVLDEGHKIKNPNAKVTKAAMRAARAASARLLMTGTPILNGLEDIWSQWYVVDLGIAFGANFVQFRREHFRETYGFQRPEPLDDALRSVSDRIALRGLRYRKDDCLDLPPKAYSVIECDMTTEQRAAYRQMADDLIVELRRLNERYDEDEVATAAMQLTVILRLSQITSGYLPASGTDTIHRFDPCPKLNALAELLEESLREESVIVWAWYREDIERISRRFAALQPSVIQGGMTRAQRDEAERRFQSGETRLIVANPASAGLGLTLARASTAVYYSQNFNLEHRAQSEDRCHRPGSEIHARIHYIDLVCRDTVDVLVREALMAKRALAEAVTDFRRHLEESAEGPRAG